MGLRGWKNADKASPAWTILCGIALIVIGGILEWNFVINMWESGSVWSWILRIFLGLFIFLLCIYMGIGIVYEGTEEIKEKKKAKSK